MQKQNDLAEIVEPGRGRKWGAFLTGRMGGHGKSSPEVTEGSHVRSLMADTVEIALLMGWGWSIKPSPQPANELLKFRESNHNHCQWHAPKQLSHPGMVEVKRTGTLSLGPVGVEPVQGVCLGKMLSCL